MPIEYSTIGGATPNDYYRDLAQSFINQSWTNNAAKTPENGGEIKEQAGIGSNEYKIIDAWVKTTVGDVTTGMRDSGDFLKIYFRDIGHVVARGLYYQFYNSWWICNEFGHFSGIAQDCGLRRCNNVLKIVDPENGSVFSAPCVVDYDMSSPSVQVSRYILTPNNHATVMVQGNINTLRLFKTNTRYVLGGRPFKLYGYQNALNLNLTTDYDTLLYLDLYLDEIHDGDDLVNGVAYNGDYNYKVKINSTDMTLSAGSTGVLTVDVVLNGKEVDRPVVWKTSDCKVATIDQNGNYVVVGEVGQSADITVALIGNEAVADSIKITVGEPVVEPEIYLDPAFNKIREYQTIEFKVKVSVGGKEIEPDTVGVGLENNGNEYLGITQTTSGWEITCYKRSSTPITMLVDVVSLSHNISKTVKFDIQAVSMMG
jgi:hypothetical protein